MLNKKSKIRIQNNRERRLVRLRSSRLTRAVEKAREPVPLAQFTEEQLRLSENREALSMFDRAYQRRLTDKMADDIDKRFALGA